MKNVFTTIAISLALCSITWAQQGIHTPAATQPGKGRLLIRNLVTAQQYKYDPQGSNRKDDDLILTTDLSYGLTGDLAFMIRGSYLTRDQETGDGFGITQHGFSDLHVMFKHRIWQLDTGPTDTQRLGVVVGLDLPTGKAPFGSNSWDPMMGVIYTEVKGRRGFNAAWRWKFNTGSRPDPLWAGDADADFMRIDFAWLYRLSPERFTDNETGAWYAMVETNTFYATNGDSELLVAPGIMYEDHGWAVEASVQLPTIKELDHRAGSELTVTVGLRLLF